MKKKSLVGYTVDTWRLWTDDAMYRNIKHDLVVPSKQMAAALYPASYSLGTLKKVRITIEEIK